MVKAFFTILEVATIAVPLFIAALFLLRTSSHYSEKFETSMFKFIGMSRRQYEVMFRLIGIICIAIASFATWQFYFSDNRQDVISENQDFWDSLEKDPNAGELLKERGEAIERNRKRNEKETAEELKMLTPVSSNTPLDISAAAALLAAAIAIPARMGSSRFPGKPLALLGKKAVIERVFESCKKSELAQKIVVLTDSPQIREFSEKIGADCIMTSEKCASGTERIVEAIDEIGAEFVVNVQGDEPFIPSKLIDEIISAHLDSRAELVTAAVKISDAQTLLNPNAVKVLRDSDGRAIYFSRTALPHIRGESDMQKWLERYDYWKHVGIYGYSTKAVAIYSKLGPCPLEKAEMLEQLRFVNAGMRFDIVETDYAAIGIDTPADLEQAEKYLRQIEG